MALSAATKYVRAAQRNEIVAPSICESSSVRVERNQSSARDEALYSTGRVMTEKSAEAAIIRIPTQNSAGKVLIVSIPRIITHVEKREVIEINGTNFERISSQA